MIRLMIDDQYETMPWDALDAVVFDVGNVLLTFNPEKLLTDLHPDDPALRATLMERMFRSPYWVMLDHGTLTSEEAAVAMAGRDEALRPVIAQMLEYRLNLKQVIAEGLDALHARHIFHVVRAAGRVGLELVLFFERLGREKFRIDKKLIFHDRFPLSRAGSRSGDRRRKHRGSAPGQGRRDRPCGRPRWPVGRRKPSGSGRPQSPALCSP